MKLLLILFIAFVIGFFIQDSCSDLIEGTNSGIQCGYGYIHNSVIGEGCKVCPPGTYNNINDYMGGKCKQCDVGKYSSSGSSKCHDTLCKSPFINKPGNKDGTECVCPANNFYEKSDKDNCFNCSQLIVDSVTKSSRYGGDKSSGSLACVCPHGKYYEKSSKFVTAKCIECKAGTYNNSLGLETNCSKCPAGKYSSEAGSSSCSDCPPGHVAIEGSASCSMCGPGTGPNGSKTACEKCGIGRFSNASTNGVCKTFVEMNCSGKFGGNATGLKDCPPVCEASIQYTSDKATKMPLDEQTQRFRFKKNIPFIEQVVWKCPILPGGWRDSTSDECHYKPIECSTDTNCGSPSFECDLDFYQCKWKSDGSGWDYDTIQKDFYNRNPKITGCDALKNKDNFSFWSNSNFKPDKK